MKSNRIFRMGAVMLAGAVAVSEVTTLTVFAENRENLMTTDFAFGEGQRDVDDGAGTGNWQGTGGRSGFVGSGEVSNSNDIPDSVSVNNGSCSPGDVGISGESGNLGTSVGVETELENGAGTDETNTKKLEEAETEKTVVGGAETERTETEETEIGGTEAERAEAEGIGAERTETEEAEIGGAEAERTEAEGIGAERTETEEIKVGETEAEGMEAGEMEGIENSVNGNASEGGEGAGVLGIVSSKLFSGRTGNTAYGIGGVEYDIAEAEVVDEGTYCGIAWQLYDNGLMVLTGEQAEDIGSSNFYGAPWYSNPTVKAVYLDFNTNGHALQKMFWNSGIVGAACGPDFSMAGTSDISLMFSGCSKLEEFDFSGQDFSSVVTMEDIFGGCSNICSITFGPGIDTGSLENLGQAFRQCSKLTSVDVENLNVGRVRTISRIFDGCGALQKLDLSGWDVRQVTDAQYAFMNCSGLQALDIRDWKLVNLENAYCMFDGACSLTELDLSGWETSEKLGNIFAMFRYCRGLKSVAFGADMVTSGVTNMAELFMECSNLEMVDLSGFSTAGCTRADSMFDGDKMLGSVRFGENFRLEQAETIERMFYGCSSLADIDLSMWTGGNLTDMSSLFYGCSGLTQVDFGESFDAGTVKKMTRMFNGCDALESIDLSNWQVGSLEDISYCFFSCSRLKTVNLEGWDTGKVTSVNWVFQYCRALETVVTPTVNGTKSITLPKEMYDWDDGNREYSTLPMGTAESITLHSTKPYSYIVEISAALALWPVEEGSLNYKGSYDIMVTGYCYTDGKCIAVFPEADTVTLTGENGREATGTVTQEKRYLVSDVDGVVLGIVDEAEARKWIALSELGTAFTGNVSAEFEVPGNYSGMVNFCFGCYGYHFDSEGKTVLDE